VVSVVSELIIVVGALFLMVTFSPSLTLISLSTIPLMFIMPYLMRRYMRRAWRQTRVKMAGLTSVVQESVSGMRVVQAFTQENRDSQVFNVANKETTRARLRATLISGVFGIGVGLAQVLGTVVLLWFGTTMMVNGEITFGTYVAFQSLIMNFWQPMMMVANFYNDFQSAMACTERIFDLLDTEQEVKEAPENERADLGDVRGEINYSNVTFGYDRENPVLKDVNLQIRPSEKVALVGPTGAGKTTMINLLCRFYDPQQGTITLDGVDLKKLSLKSLRSRMGIVLQDTFLFQGTVKDNIKYGKPDATDGEVVEAAQAVNAHEFILRLPQGYDTVIREGSTNISIGQRQLITFARALLVNPKILILDEATSSVDPYTELIIQKGLEKLLENRTSIIIAHRLSTVRNSDKIVVIDHGEIRETGKHDELLDKGGIYENLYMRQFREEPEEEEAKIPVRTRVPAAIGAMPRAGRGRRGPAPQRQK
jgi:ABC-type multidrug transport system fused ATPase/permease subunit